jgi:hypothetical protein
MDILVKEILARAIMEELDQLAISSALVLQKQDSFALVTALVLNSTEPALAPPRSTLGSGIPQRTAPRASRNIPVVSAATNSARLTDLEMFVLDLERTASASTESASANLPSAVSPATSLARQTALLARLVSTAPLARNSVLVDLLILATATVFATPHKPPQLENVLATKDTLELPVNSRVLSTGRPTTGSATYKVFVIVKLENAIATRHTVVSFAKLDVRFLLHRSGNNKCAVVTEPVSTDRLASLRLASAMLDGHSPIAQNNVLLLLQLSNALDTVLVLLPLRLASAIPLGLETPSVLLAIPISQVPLAQLLAVPSLPSTAFVAAVVALATQHLEPAAVNSPSSLDSGE